MIRVAGPEQPRAPIERAFASPMIRFVGFEVYFAGPMIFVPRIEQRESSTDDFFSRINGFAIIRGVNFAFRGARRRSIRARRIIDRAVETSDPANAIIAPAVACFLGVKITAHGVKKRSADDSEIIGGPSVH